MREKNCHSDLRTASDCKQSVRTEHEQKTATESMCKKKRVENIVVAVGPLLTNEKVTVRAIFEKACYLADIF